MRTKIVIFLSTAIFLAPLSSAWAQARLLESIPSPESTAAAPRSIKLTFSEKIAPDAGLQLSMADGMTLSTRTSLSSDGKTLTARPISPFMSGRWTVSWRATAADGQKTQGSYSFTIK